LATTESQTDENFILEDGIVYSIEVPILDECNGKLKNPLVGIVLMCSQSEPGRVHRGPISPVSEMAKAPHATDTGIKAPRATVRNPRPPTPVSM
jgi:hypothetical protein